MLPEPKTSPFAYVLAAVLAVAGWFLLRPKSSPPPSAPTPAASKAPGESALTEASDQEIMDAFAMALSRAGLPPMRSPRDVLTVLLATRPPPTPADANRATLDAALQRQREAIESVLAGTSAVLSPEQLAVFRTVLERDLAALQARRAQAKP